jgi:Mn-dependent DtxR family transcriptional regulator
MSDLPMEDLKTMIVEFFKAKGKMMTSRDVAKGLDLENRLVKQVLTELVNEGTLEFTSYGGASFIKLPDSQ